jgi:putative hemolysin
MDSGIWTYALLYCLCLILLGLASAAQASFAYVNAARLRHLMQHGVSRAQAMFEVVHHPGPFLASVALLYLLSSSAAALVVYRFVALYIEPSLGWQLLVGAVALLLAFTVQMFSRGLAAARPEMVAVVLYRPLRVISWITRPLVAPWYWLTTVILRQLFERGVDDRGGTTEEDLRVLVDAVEETEALEEDERDMIASIFEMSDRDVSEIMVPRIDLVAAEGASTVDETVDLLVQTGHSRIPVYEGDLDHVLGLVHLRDLTAALRAGRGQESIGTMVRPVHVVPETKKIDELLHEFQADHVQMAVVVDEYGGTEGLVTIEDLLEEIVGEIRDEYDVEEDLIQVISDREAIMDGRVSIHDANEVLPLGLNDDDYDTIAGLVYGSLEKIPLVGDTVTIGPATMRVLSTKGRRIQRIQVTLKPEEPVVPH